LESIPQQAQTLAKAEQDLLILKISMQLTILLGELTISSMITATTKAENQ